MRCTENCLRTAEHIVRRTAACGRQRPRNKNFGLISRGCGLLCYVMSTWLMSTCANSNAFSSDFPTAHRPTAGLYLQGLLAQFHCSVKLNIFLTCVKSYPFFFRAP